MQYPYAMRDLPLMSHSGEQHQRPGHYGAEGIGSPINVRHLSLPGTPSLVRTIPFHPGGSPAVPPRHNHMGLDPEFQQLPLRRQIVSQVSLDSPLSPSMRPHSPWGRFDPYDSPEVCFYYFI